MVYETIRGELKAYYAAHSITVPGAKDFPVKPELDAWAEAHPGASALALKAAQYRAVTDHARPVIFAHSPFWGEIGLKVAEYTGPGSTAGGWLLNRNLHLYRDFDPAAFDSYNLAGWIGLHLCYGPYCDYDHHCFPYTSVFEQGLSGLYSRACEAEKKASDPAKKEFYEAAKLGLECLKRIGEHCADAALEKISAAATAEERENYARIADAAKRVPWERPVTFYEGIASLWFLHEIMSVMDGVSSSVLGHFDRLLTPLYEADLAAGRITESAARELVAAYLLHTDCKLSTDLPTDQQYNAGEQGDTLILGGTDVDGKSLWSGLSLLVLRTHREIGALNPKIHCRVAANTPRIYLEETARDFLAGRNVLSYLNDDLLIPAQVRAGKDRADAVNYVCGGCWEVILESCEHSEGANCYFSLGKMMDLSVRAEKDLEKRLGFTLAGLDGAADFEEVFRRAAGNALTAIRAMCGTIARCGRIWPDVNPCPLFSAGLKGCLESGLDYTAGGAKYSPHGLPFTGLAHFVDSLMVIDTLCFRDRVCSLETLLNAVRGDWKNALDLRRRALNCEHLGDGRGRASALACRVLKTLLDGTRDLKNERGGAFQPGLYSYSDVFEWAGATLATPDGRRQGDFLEQGPMPSRLRGSDGITGLLNEMAALPLGDFPANSVVTASLQRAGLTEKIFTALVRSFCQTGPGMLQLNCLSREELADAEAHPERHRDLIVRLYGFSVRFVTLDARRRAEFVSRGLY